MQHILVEFQRFLLALGSSTRQTCDMAEHERDNNEQWLSYGDAVALLRDRLGVTGGRAQMGLQIACKRDGVLTQGSSRPTWAVAFPWEKVKYSRRDLEVWMSEKLERLEHLKRLERLERLEASPTAPAATSMEHTYRNAGDAELVERGVRMAKDEGLTHSETARRLVPE